MVVVCICIFERFTVLMVYLLIKLEALGNFALVKPGKFVYTLNVQVLRVVVG